MKSQQAAEREEQQRIKSLVLNYDMHDENDHDGEPCPHGLDLRQSETPWMMDNPNTKGLPLGSERHSASHTRSEGGSRRNQQRARKLQLNDLDWYGKKDRQNDAPIQEQDKGTRGRRSSPRKTYRRTVC